MSEQRASGGHEEAVDGDAIEVAGAQPWRARGRRSPIVSMIVVAFGVYLLTTMFGDARYWARSDTPQNLGDAATFVASGGLAQDHSEQFVVLEGTPDARTAARYRIGEQRVQLLRITEGGSSLFAAVPRAEDDRSDEYEGRYEGRMRRLASSSMLPWIQQYYADLRLTESLDISPQALRDGLASGQFKTASGVALSLPADTRVSLAKSIPDVRVQLGRKSFPSRAKARAAMTDLGYPFFEPEEQDNAKFYQFWARIPAAERDDARARLNAGLGQVDAAQASEGAAILPGSATFWVPLSALAVDGDAFTFPEQPGMPRSLFKVDGTSLVSSVEDGQVRIPIDDSLRSAQLERPLVVDPAGYIINVGEKPSSHRVAPLLWLAALIVVLLNLISLAVRWRR